MGLTERGLGLMLLSVAQLTTDGDKGTKPTGKLNVKTGPPLSLYFGIYYYIGFQ